jgi:putative ABC transport system permease protein
MDFRLALRQLIRRPGFTVVALVTLALGIGAPTAMFSVVHAVLLRPLPYPEADRLVRFRMNSQSPAGPVSFDALPVSEALAWAEESRAIAGLALFNDRALTLSTPDGPFRLIGVSATPNLFDVLRTRPEAGGTFTVSGTETREVVLSHTTWQRFFAANPSTVGSLVTLDGDPYRVVGVMPDAFRFPSAETAFWVPQPLSAGGTRGMVLPAIARLRPDATIDTVASEGTRLIDNADRRSATTLTVESLHDQMTGGVRRILWVLLGAVGFVTIIATANIALLLLTRGAGREREFSIRAALGAGRARLIRQLFVEGMTLGGIGGFLGLAFAWTGLSLLVNLAPAGVPRLTDAALNGTVLIFAVLLTAGTSLMFGVLSAGRTLRLSPWRALAGSETEGRLTAATGPMRFRTNILAVSELGLTMVLLVAAGLLLRSFAGLVNADQGFDLKNAAALQVNLPASRYASPAARLGYDERLLEQVRRQPGIDVAGLATTLPTRQPTGRFGFSSSPTILAPADPFSIPAIDVHMVTEGFLEAMGVRLLEGRTFLASDRAGSEPVVVISKRWAEQQFPGRSAVGQTLYSGTGNRVVVGVVADVRPAELGVDTKPDAYLPLSQNPDVLQWFSTITLITRGANPDAIGAALRPVILALDPQSPPYNVRTLDADVARVVAAPRFSATVLALFAGVAFLMACVGVYGVMAFASGQRTREIGIRLAVGATRAQILRLILKDGSLVVLVGLAGGLGAALILTRTLTGLLHEVTPADPATLMGVASLLAMAGIVATLIPALRATRIDPLKTLKEE